MVVEDILPSMVDAVAQYLLYDPASQTYTEFLPARDMDQLETPLDPRYARTPTGQVTIENSGAGSNLIVLSNSPVRSITSLYENPSAWDSGNADGPGDWPASTLLVQGQDYTVDWSSPGFSKTGVIRRASGYWQMSRRGIKVTYVAGYTDDEFGAGGVAAPIRDALMLAVQRRFISLKSYQRGSDGRIGGVVASESLDGWSISYESSSLQKMGLGMAIDLPDESRVKLQPFARLPMSM